MPLASEVLIKGGHGGRVDIKMGQLLEVKNVDGNQICDFFAFSRENVHEHLSAAHTRSVLGRIYIQKGDALSTVWRRTMFEMIEDTCGQHDLTIPACDPQRYLNDYGLSDHRSCRMNLMEQIPDERVPYEYLPEPINLFQNTPLQPDGRYQRGLSPARAGDKVILRATMDLIAVGSACPNDLHGGNRVPLGDILLVVHDAN